MASKTKTGYVRIMVYLPPSMADKWDEYKAHLAREGIVKDSDVITYVLAQEFKRIEEGATLDQVATKLEEIKELLRQLSAKQD